jgi:hypothetical protein
MENFKKEYDKFESLIMFMENYLKAKHDDDHETLKRLKIKPIKEKSKSEKKLPPGLKSLLIS